jgi:hypothetical protein
VAFRLRPALRFALCVQGLEKSLKPIFPLLDLVEQTDIPGSSGTKNKKK